MLTLDPEAIAASKSKSKGMPLSSWEAPVFSSRSRTVESARIFIVEWLRLEWFRLRYKILCYTSSRCVPGNRFRLHATLAELSLIQLSVDTLEGYLCDAVRFLRRSLRPCP